MKHDSQSKKKGKKSRIIDPPPKPARKVEVSENLEIDDSVSTANNGLDDTLVFSTSQEAKADQEPPHPCLLGCYRKRLLIGVVFMLLLLLAYTNFVVKDPPEGSVHFGASPGTHQPPNKYEQKVTDVRGNQYLILQTYTREATSYTQGFYFMPDGTLLESTGLTGASQIQYRSLDHVKGTSEIKSKTALPSTNFGEGCDVISNGSSESIYQLTWQNGKTYQYDSKFKLKKVHETPSELNSGWGMSHKWGTTDTLLLTDGSNRVFLTDTKNGLKVKEIIAITGSDGHSPQRNINELEWVEDYLWANIYLTNDIVAIDLDDRKVAHMFDFSVLRAKAEEAYLSMTGRDLGYDQCLNGIAYDRKEQVFYITGKQWPLIFKVWIPLKYLVKSKK